MPVLPDQQRPVHSVLPVAGLPDLPGTDPATLGAGSRVSHLKDGRSRLEPAPFDGVYARKDPVSLQLCGISANIPAILAFQSNNVVGQAKKSFASAMVIGAGGVGGIVASVSFREHDAPKYEPGLWTSIAFSVAQIALTGALTFHFARRNALVRIKGGKPIEGMEGFLYTL